MSDNNILKEFLDPAILNRYKDIKHHYIGSENPDDHWNYLAVNNEIVLDMGCGFHLIEPGWDSTPAYFIKRGAEKVIGIDTEKNDIIHLQKSFPEHNFYCDTINSSIKIENYINTNKVTSLKMDIEGEEKHFINSSDTFPTLKYVAIESHSKILLHDLIKKLDYLNFNIDIVCTFYPRVYNICNLIYASRKNL